MTYETQHLLVKFDLSTGKFSSINLGYYPVAVSSDGTHVWVVGYRGNGDGSTSWLVTELDASTGAVLHALIPVVANPTHISSDGNHVWVAGIVNNFAAGVTEIDATTGTVVQPDIAIPSTVEQANDISGITSDGTDVWVSQLSRNKVTEISTSTGAVIGSPIVVSSPNAISSDGRHVWVASGSQGSFGTVTEIDAATASIVGSPITVGDTPNDISADGKDVWVPNEFSGTVSDISSELSGVSLTPGNPTAGATSPWTVGFTSSPAGALTGGTTGHVDDVAVIFPTAVTLPASPTTTLGAGFVGTCSNPQASNYIGRAIIVGLPAGCSLDPSTVASFTIDGITNPSAQTITATNFAVDTSGDPRFVNPTSGVTFLPAPTISISNLPTGALVGGGFTATLATNGDGATSVTSSTPSVCTVSGSAVSYLANGICTLNAHVGVGTNYGSADGATQGFVVSTPNPYHPLTPTRICDTRTIGPLVPSNQCNSTGPQFLSGGATKVIQVTGLGGVPASGVSAVVLNVTVTNTSAASFLTVYPTGVALPNASNLNWSAGKTIPNLVEVPVGTGGQVSIHNSKGQVDVIVDVEGYVGPAAAPGAGLYNPLSPARICDTRTIGPLVPSNQCNSTGPQFLSGGATKVIQVTGLGGVPASGVSAVVLNVTVTNTSAGSFLAAFPDGLARPNVSNLNWSAGTTIPNRVVVPVGTDGKIDLYNSVGAADVIVDVAGWFTDASNAAATGSLYVPIAPTRICDTRTIGPFVPSNQCNSTGTQILSGGATKTIQVTGLGGVPASGVSAVVLNATVTNTSAASFLTVFPHGITLPNASDLNWSAGTTIPNLVIATLPPGGSLDIYNSQGATDAIVDIEGYYVASP